MGEHSADCTFEDIGDAVALLAVQGPRAVALVNRLCAADVADVRPFHSTDTQVAGVQATVSRTGYTGEDGFELYVEAGDAPGLWDTLLDAGAADGLIPCGLGARDTLRLEAGLRLYGQDMDEHTDPYSCGLGWTVKLAEGGIHRQRGAGPARSQASAAAFCRHRAPGQGHRPARPAGACRRRGGRRRHQRDVQLHARPLDRDRIPGWQRPAGHRPLG